LNSLAGLFVEAGMNKNILRWIALGLIATTGVSCTTAYDAYGRPQTVVDPGVALLGAAAVGIAAFALANDDGCDWNDRRFSSCRPRPRRYSNNCW
jgi:hypothetical protein